MVSIAKNGCEPWLLTVIWFRHWCEFLNRSKDANINLTVESMKISQL